jgi:excisionase family DNA binding protein
MSRNKERTAPTAQSAKLPPAPASTTLASTPELGGRKILQALIDSHVAAANVLKQALREVEVEDDLRRVQAALPDERVAQAPTSAPTPEHVDWRLVTISDACKGLGISRTTIYAMIAAKKLSVVKVGRRTLIKVAELQELSAPRIR